MKRMRLTGFRAKLLVAMMIPVIAVTGTSLYVTQHAFQTEYRLQFEERFALQRQLFSSQQKWISDRLEQQLMVLVRKQRIQLALLESDVPELYEQVRDELVVRGLLPQQGAPATADHLSFFVFMDPDGRPLLPGAEQPATSGLRTVVRALEDIGDRIARADGPSLAYLSIRGDVDEPVLHRAVFAPVDDNATGERLGVFGLIFRAMEFAGQSRGQATAGLYFDGEIYAPGLGRSERAVLSSALRGRTAAAEEDDSRKVPDEDLVVNLGGIPHRILHESLGAEPGRPRAWLVAVISMADAIAGENQLRRRVLIVGAAGLMLSLLLSAVLSRGLTDPIHDLVRATGVISEGDFDYRVSVRSRDEIGQLGVAFNDMAMGLAQRRRLRNILDMVADKEVAHALVAGDVVLGGEMREVTVLFCDIRAFTTLCEGMNPGDVIRILNEHFTPLTRIVYQHHGVVDKFVGDMIMAVFGAPRSHGDDAFDACRCALAMIAARRDLNHTSMPQIEIGIGVASGVVVAGCMGSADRLNYTVLGARINLASRLCSSAAPMQVLVDAATREKVDGRLGTTPLGVIDLKGLAAPVEAFVLQEPVPRSPQETAADTSWQTAARARA